MKVAIVVPNWDGAMLITACLQSLESQSYPAEIIVVDNGSRDESVAIIERNFPNVTLISLPKNTGFAGGVNTGIKYAQKNKYDAAALFNNDAVADRDWLKRLVDVMSQDSNIGIVSCKQLRSDGKHIDSTGDCYSIWGMPFPRGRNHKDAGQFDKAEEIFSAPAGATLYRAEMLKEIGLFDEKFFAYYEDVDISFRARLAGWNVLYEPSAKVYHAVSATGSKLGSFTRYHATKNFYMLYVKNMPGWLFWKYFTLVFLQGLRLGASSFLRGDGWAYLRGHTRAVINIPYTLRERNKIQPSRRIDVAEIDRWLYKHRPPRIPKI